jgi:hypothetical protein
MTNPGRSYEFAMSFVAASEKYRQQYIERWREAVSNFIVEPYNADSSTRSPYSRSRSYGSSANPLDNIVLKDPETHKAIMTFASSLVKSVLGDRDKQYVKAKPRGYEDAPQKAPTVSALLRYSFGLPGHFRTFVEAIVDMLLFGTSIIEVNWCYEQREMPVREVTSELGVETSQFIRLPVPVYDDVKLTVLDINDFYPDPMRYRIQDMVGAAKKFKMNAIEANYKAESGIYDKAAVARAISDIGKGQSNVVADSFRAGLDQPTTDAGMSDFREMIGYEYWGNVPWIDDAGSSRRVITVLNNVVVRDEPYPLGDPALPFHTMIINPVQGRFYGISPAEVIRYDQDLADGIKKLLAKAIIRQVHPPIVVDPDSVDPQDLPLLRAWKADQVIPVRGGPSGAGVLPYNANVQNGFAMLMALKDSMQQASGALGAIQGEDGPDREAATVGAARIQGAMSRPELAAMVLESECFPPIAGAILRRYQQFLPDTEALKLRVGEQPDPIWIGDIMGDFDVEFVGSRLMATKQEKLQSYDRLVALATAIPPLMMQIPWEMIGRDVVGDLLELPEVAAQMADPRTLMMNLMIQQAAGGQTGGPANNGVAQASEPAGMLPAQAAGNEFQ